MNPELKQRWIEALESDKYTQGKYELFNKEDNKHCCLGVLCEVANIPKDQSLMGYKYNNVFYGILAPVKLLPKTTQQILTSLNDGGKSFKEIAAYIKEFI